MSDREFGGNDDLSLPKGEHLRTSLIPPSPGAATVFRHDTSLTPSLVSFPATVQKIITEILATTDSESSITFARDARDLLIDCCVEFITLISSEANEIAEREAKKTIATEHIDKALKELGFPEYVREVLASAGEMKESLKTREKKTSKMDQSGLTQEELLQQQQELFASATSKFNQGP